jgi:DNA/RNA endonuclease YhcR with UshA esterase domain
MDDSILLRVALLVSVSGMFLMWYAANLVEPEVVPIGDIDEGWLGEVVFTTGKVSGVDHFGGISLVSFEGAGVKLFAFFNLSTEIGKNITVKGEVKEYKGTLEIVPRSEEDVKPG